MCCSKEDSQSSVRGICEKMILLFHCLEEVPKLKKVNSHQQFHILIKDIILILSRLPIVNSLIYVPFCLFATKNVNVWNGVNFSGAFGTTIPIISAHFLSEKNTFKQFSFRIRNLSFSSRIQFEEIWMTLLGVFSENISILSQSTSDNGLSECITTCKQVIDAITHLLCNAQQKEPSESYTSKSDSFRASLKNTKYGLIQHKLSEKINSIEKSLSIFNRTLSINAPFCENIKLAEKASPIEPAISSDMNNSIDLYSCIQFLLDLYLQTVKSYTSTALVHFPILSEIVKSCVFVSDLFVENNQFKKLLELLMVLSSLTEHFDDEVMNQYLIVGIAKSYSVLANSDDILEKHKKLVIELYFKDFFLPMRISSIRSIKFLVSCPNIVTFKDLSPVLEYIAKHLNVDHTM